MLMWTILKKGFIVSQVFDVVTAYLLTGENAQEVETVAVPLLLKEAAEQQTRAEQMLAGAPESARAGVHALLAGNLLHLWEIYQAHKAEGPELPVR